MDEEKKLLRPEDGRMIAGVCAGIARYFTVDVTLVRVVTAIGAVVSCGTFLLAYLVAWLLIPVE